MEHLISIGELPYPNGWFAVAWSRELRLGRELRRRLMGEDLVVSRTRAGTPVVAKPSGRGTYEVRECNGAVFAWWHAEGRAPYWELPELRDPGFASPILKQWSLPAYPQDIHENAFDIGHFPALHGYHSATSESVSFEGVASTSELITRRYFPVAGALSFPLHCRGFGMGFTKIVADIPQIRCQGESFFYATPTDPNVIDFRVSIGVRGVRGVRGMRGERGGHGMRERPGRAALALSWLLAQTLGRSMRLDLNDDDPIWTHKVYVDRPRLAEGDGPIQRYRNWARQFYTWPASEQEQEQITEHIDMKVTL